jgi:hypothetical protein
MNAEAFSLNKKTQPFGWGSFFEPRLPESFCFLVSYHNL